MNNQTTRVERLERASPHDPDADAPVVVVPSGACPRCGQVEAWTLPMTEAELATVGGSRGLDASQRLMSGRPPLPPPPSTEPVGVGWCSLCTSTLTDPELDLCIAWVEAEDDWAGDGGEVTAPNGA